MIEVTTKGHNGWTVLKFNCPFCNEYVSWGFWNGRDLTGDDSKVICNWSAINDAPVGCYKQIFILKRNND